MWLPAEGVRTEYAEDVYEVTPAADEQSVSLLCPVRQVHTRGHTLNTPTVTLVSYSPCASSGMQSFLMIPGI